LDYLELRAKFPKRTSGNIQKPQGVLIRASAGTFGNIRRNGNRCATNLINERKVFPHLSNIDRSIDFDRKVFGGPAC
jgi:hypothetical protein